MNRLSRNDNDEEYLYERQALIEDEELNDDDLMLVSDDAYGVRHRSSQKSKSISNVSKCEVHELDNIVKTRDLISEPFVEFTYCDIAPGDSLQSICLRYACSVNQVKRLNGLISDQDFYGLRRIKLPLGKLGLLEDVLKLQDQNSNRFRDREYRSNQINMTRPRIVNSPGSALSVSTGYAPRFKPLLSPGYSSDRINELNKAPKVGSSTNRISDSFEGGILGQQLHSHSFSSLRDFDKNDLDMSIEQKQQQYHVDTKHLKHQSFIKPNIDHHEEIGSDESLSMRCDNVDKVFQELDYHLERAKAVVETYDQRAAELVTSMNDNASARGLNFVSARVSKIPEIFFCNEDFGLNYKKLLVFVFILCFLVPLVYINQAKIVTT